MKINFKNEHIKSFIKKGLNILLKCLIILGIITAIICIVYFATIHHNRYEVYEEMTSLTYEKTKYELVNEVDKYIKATAKASCLNGIIVVNKCIKYDVDICFVLAQGQIESHFGTQGLARKTNSVWNVFAYDGQSFIDISEKGKYKSPDDSLEPYLHLLKQRYICNGKTEYDLLNKYVDKNGKRYASSEMYEANLRNAFAGIKESTTIDSLSLELKKYAIILGK